MNCPTSSAAPFIPPQTLLQKPPPPWICPISLGPNRWGLFDVTGNVSEWCRDRHVSYARPTRWGDGLRDDPAARYRVARGGCYLHWAAKARIALREHFTPNFTSAGLGLRPALGTTK